MLLIGDLGGTKVNLAIISEETGPRVALAEATLPSSDFITFEAALQHFLRGSNARIERAVFGVAGPVIEGCADITNLEWIVDERRIAEALGIGRVRLLNDLAAVAYSIPRLSANELQTVNAGQAAPGGTLAVIAPGTGLGEAYLVWDGAEYRPQPSEGGHASFSPLDHQQAALLTYLLDRLDHVSTERVCSGSGIPNIYDYLRDTGFAPEPEWLAAQLADAEDRTPIIVSAALDGGSDCALCHETLRMFVSILGVESGNLALKVMATGGVFLAGGIPPRILSALVDGLFLESFFSKGRMSPLLEQMPVHVVLNPKAAMLGAAHYALHPPQS